MDFTVRLIDVVTAPAKLASSAITGLDKSLTAAGKASDALNSKITSAGKSVSSFATNAISKVTAPLSKFLDPVISKYKEVGNQIASSKTYQLGAAGVQKVGAGLSFLSSTARTAGSTILGNMKSIGSSAMGIFSKIGPLGAAGLALAAGAAGASLGKLALGEVGMARLEAISARFGQNIRNLFKGIDSKPFANGLLRLSNIFSQNSASGKALGSLLKTVFGGAFSIFDKLSKVAEVAILVAILGLKKLELAFLKLQLVALPVIWAIEDGWEENVGPAFKSIQDSIGKLMTDVGKLGAIFSTSESSASSLGSVLVGVFGAAITNVSMVLSVVTSVFGGVVQVITGVVSTVKAIANGDWKGAIESFHSIISGGFNIMTDVVFAFVGVVARGMDLVGKALGKDWDFTSKVTNIRESTKKMVSDGLASTRTGGKSSGEALGDGMTNGMKNKEGEVYEAGKKLAEEAMKGVTDTAKIASPSKIFTGFGGFMGQGLAIGLEKETDNVNQAASNLVPKMNDIMIPGSSMNLGVGISDSSSFGRVVNFHENAIVIQGAGDAKEIAMEVRRIIDDYSDETATAMGAN